jgi:hypothetical protein
MEKIITVRIRFMIMVIASVTGGIMIYLVDSSKGWDDTGVTAVMLFSFSLLSGFIYQKRLWLWAILTGIWIPLFAIINSGNYSMIPVLAITFAGSFAGGLFRTAIKKP